MPRPISYAVFCLKKTRNPPYPLRHWISCRNVLIYLIQVLHYHIHLHSFPTRRSSDLADLPPSPTKSSNLSETAEVPACNVPSRSPLPALAVAPETKLGTASSGLGTLEP